MEITVEAIDVRDEGAGADAPPERRGRADRKYAREYIVLRAIVFFDDEPPLSCGLMDVSVAGAKVKLDDYSPEIGTKVLLQIDALKVRARGKVLRVFPTPSGIEVAIKFDQIYNNIPGRLLEYKLRSFQDSPRGGVQGRPGGGKRRGFL